MAQEAIAGSLDFNGNGIAFQPEDGVAGRHRGAIGEVPLGDESADGGVAEARNGKGDRHVLPRGGPE